MLPTVGSSKALAPSVGNASQEPRSIPFPLPWQCQQPDQARILPLGKQSPWVTFLSATAGGTLPGMQFGPERLLRALHPSRASPGRYCSLQALHRHYQAFGGL